MTAAVRPALTRKYVPVIAARYSSTSEGAGVDPYKGAAPLSVKNSVPASQIARPRLAKLKAVCAGRHLNWNEMRRPSRARTTAPTLGPKSRTDVKAKISETEKRDCSDGIFRLNAPL